MLIIYVGCCYETSSYDSRSNYNSKRHVFSKEIFLILPKINQRFLQYLEPDNSWTVTLEVVCSHNLPFFKAYSWNNKSFSPKPFSLADILTCWCIQMRFQFSWRHKYIHFVGCHELHLRDGRFDFKHIDELPKKTKRRKCYPHKQPR